MSLDSLGSFTDSLCEYFCWALQFEGPARLLWLALLWFALEFLIRAIARYNVSSNIKEQTFQHEDQGSWWIIALASSVMAVIILLALHFKWQTDLPEYLVPIGFILMGLGIALRAWAVICLKEFFTMHVKISSNHRLIKNGPYKFVRHPSYLGVFITTVGFGLASGYFFVLIAFLVILGGSLGYRIYVEEKALSEKFDKEWQRYSENTWAIFPGIW